jgi:hypothetical protein
LGWKERREKDESGRKREEGRILELCNPCHGSSWKTRRSKKGQEERSERFRHPSPRELNQTEGTPRTAPDRKSSVEEVDRCCEIVIFWDVNFGFEEMDLSAKILF